MGRLIDADSLKGCAIIRPTSHETIEHIKQCGNDVLNHNDIPTAYDVEKVVEDLQKASMIVEQNENSIKCAIEENMAVHIVKRGGVEC